MASWWQMKRNGRLDTGRKLFWSPASSPTFFNSGRTEASLNAAGKQPAVSDLLISSKMKGDKSPRMSFTSHVGAGRARTFYSSRTDFWISSAVTAVQSWRGSVWNVVDKRRSSGCPNTVDFVLEKGSKVTSRVTSSLVEGYLAKCVMECSPIWYMFGSPGGTPGALATEMRDILSGIDLRAWANFQPNPLSTFTKDALKQTERRTV